MEDETYNGWSNWDTWNTMLLLDNTQATQKWLGMWKLNWLKKIKKGTFDMAQAEKAVEKYIVPVARGLSPARPFIRQGFVPDPEINPKKVNKKEIVNAILDG